MRRFICGAILLTACLVLAPAQAQHSREDTQRLQEDLVRLCGLHNYPHFCVDAVTRVMEAHQALVKIARSRNRQGLTQAEKNYNQALTRLRAIAPTLADRYLDEVLGYDL
jgi:hypothetical protein